MTADDRLGARRGAFEAALAREAAGFAPRMPAQLAEAMSYSLLAGGKRLRPLLCLASAELCGAPPELPASRDFALALECIHTYSLIHDDLPAMDDDDLRRGRPTCHKVFGEATAILAGDALLTEAFAIASRGDEPMRLRLIALLARASGGEGMVGGQELDLAMEGRVDAAPALVEVEEIHRRKTGALIAVATEGGAVAAGVPRAQIEALRSYGEALGLAFQIADDILDVVGDPAAMGKRGRGDEAKGKPTYPVLLGLDGAKARAIELRDRAIGALHAFGPAAEDLRTLARQVVDRAG